MTTQPLEDVVAKTERRRWQRKKFRANMEMEWGSALLAGIVRDIGPQGLFVEMTQPLWVGATFRARLRLDSDLWLNCTLVRVEPGSGIAVLFEVPDETGKAQVEMLLANLPPV
jgi:hypothetical protein